MKHKHAFFKVSGGDSLKPKHIFSLILAVLLIGGLFTLGVMRLAYKGKLLPGASAYGVYLGGLTPTEANALIDRLSLQYQAMNILSFKAGDTAPITMTAKELTMKHTSQPVVSDLYSKGRTGYPWTQLTEQLALMTSDQSSSKEKITYDGALFQTKLIQAYQSQNTPSKNAFLTINASGNATTSAAQPGQRLDTARTIDLMTDRVRLFEPVNIIVPTYQIEPVLSADQLTARLETANGFIKTPITLTYDKQTWPIPSTEILAWLSYAPAQPPVPNSLLQNYYQVPASRVVTNNYDMQAIQTYLSAIQKEIYKEPIDAKLTISGERATVFQQSQDGLVLDMPATSVEIVKLLKKPTELNTTGLIVVVKKAEVTDDNLDRLGIKELLSEGVSYFPGSSANRMTNVRVGSALYNGVLLKPGQVFSFGAILGEVGPAQGYKEGRIILEGRQESAYGGGLCQVSSTAFRAALLAGLPIVERVNHSFAVSYYTEPFGVPGVDATIYYPEVDFKFKNDTDHHILIQTEMVGTTLKFRFYGTKQKTGAIRGPSFIYGSNDPNQPSRTVFYRDILVNGAVTKTDAFYTNYKSALDFPVATN
ncbi:MAG: VanW family protein [bacterium]